MFLFLIPFFQDEGPPAVFKSTVVTTHLEDSQYFITV